MWLLLLLLLLSAALQFFNQNEKKKQAQTKFISPFLFIKFFSAIAALYLSFINVFTFILLLLLEEVKEKKKIKIISSVFGLYCEKLLWNTYFHHQFENSEWNQIKKCYSNNLYNSNMLPVPQDRTSGRRSSSIGCRSLIGRRTSTYIASQSSLAHTDPSKASHSNLFFIFHLCFFALKLSLFD